MEEESLLDTLFHEENAEYAQDVDMEDIEEGELKEQIPNPEIKGSCDTKLAKGSHDSNQKNSRKKKKKKNKRKPGSGSGANVTDINKFVLDVCKRLRERKSYLVYTAVGCLGISAFSDLIQEVDAIQACGGQKTADGGRFRNGGGILWNIIKIRDPNVYKEIMTKGKEFEKQFKPQNEDRKIHFLQTEASAQRKSLNAASLSNCLEISSQEQNQPEESDVRVTRSSVHDRIRMPVSYDDLHGEEGVTDG